MIAHELGLIRLDWNMMLIRKLDQEHNIESQLYQNSDALND